jgi:hypothetical protein
MARCVQGTDFDAVADAKCRVVAGCVRNMSAVLAANDGYLVLFELVVNELRSPASEALMDKLQRLDELYLGFRRRGLRGCE